jgi:uncharacterized protein YfdQ (DUF2303 family)
MNDDTITDIESAIQAGMLIGEPKTINGTPVIVLPKGAEIQELDHLRDKPQHIAQYIRVHTAESFTRYFNQFATDDSIILVDTKKASILGIIDFHMDADHPDWCAHRLHFTMAATHEWNAWQTNSGTWFGQEAFGLFLEENLDEIIDPPGAEMLEIALNLKAKTGIHFRKSTRLDNGEIKLLYEETIDASAGIKGEFKVPEQFTIGLRLFEGGEPYKLNARLRYRIKDGQLTLKYDLVRPHKTHEAAVADTEEYIRNVIDHGEIIHGEIA